MVLRVESASLTNEMEFPVLTCVGVKALITVGTFIRWLRAHQGHNKGTKTDQSKEQEYHTDYT